MNREQMTRAKIILEEMKEDYHQNGVRYTTKIEMLEEGIKALTLLGHLKNRPCEVCEFNKGNGCTKWDCVFEV